MDLRFENIFEIGGMVAEREKDQVGAISVGLTSAAKRALAQMSAESGLKKQAIVEKALEWLARQDDEVRSLVLGHIPESLTAAVVRAMLEKMQQPPPSPEAGVVVATPRPQEKERRSNVSGKSVEHAGQRK